MSGQRALEQACASDSASLPLTHEIPFSDREFDQFRSLILNTTGINMGPSKRHLLYRRLIMRLQALNIHSIAQYLELLLSGDGSEFQPFINAITTNLTSFFREKHHFDYLAQSIVPELLDRKAPFDRRLRVWCAGCSTGEESYSLAMTLREALQDHPAWDARVLCTDLDTHVVATAKTGVYAERRMHKVPVESVNRWFTRRGDFYEARPELTTMLTFKPLNLMSDWPMRGKFDVIFCRNVVIYFDKSTQRVLMKRFADMLQEGGYLILGHSESLFNVSDQFELIGRSIHRKAR